MSPLVLVTGASGRIGQSAIPILRRRGWTVRAMVHRAPVDGADESVRADLGDADSLAAAAADVDAVLHMASVTHSRRPRTYARVNVDGTANLIRAFADRHPRRMVLVSSRTASESGGAYSRSKLEAERLMRSAGFPTTVVRLPEVFGTGEETGIERVLSAVARGRPVLLPGDGSQQVCPLHVRDVVGPLAAALDSGDDADRDYTIAGTCMTVREFANLCGIALGRPVRAVSVPLPLLGVLAGAARLIPLPLAPDQVARLTGPRHPLSETANRDLGFDPIPTADRIREAVLGERP